MTARYLAKRALQAFFIVITVGGIEILGLTGLVVIIIGVVGFLSVFLIPAESRRGGQASEIRQFTDERGMPRIRYLVLSVVITVFFVLVAAFMTIYGGPFGWLWWIPAGIFIFWLVMMSLFYLMMRREREREERKGV
jgi:sterol desaturase/sphingolipid hydroxylase (fatty acid hydroxylase superfamily)